MEKIFVVCINEKGKLETFYIKHLEKNGVTVKEASNKNPLVSFLNMIKATSQKGIVFHQNSILRNSNADNILFINVTGIHPKDVLKKLEKWIKNKSIHSYVPEKIIKFYQKKLPKIKGHDFLRNRCSGSRPAF